LVAKVFLETKFFYLLFFLALITIFFSNPFLRVPYDMWYHLERIEFYSSQPFSIFEIKNKELWPYLWGSFFSFLHIDELFVRTKIIHLSQSLISFFIIYFTSHVIIRNLFKHIDTLTLKYLSLWSVFIWFTIYATFSVYYHQVWILWYSINYQITLLFFWYIIALLLIVILEKPNKQTVLFYLFQIVLFSIIILWMHASEFIYVSLYLLLILLIYIKDIYYFTKKNYLQSVIATLLILVVFYYFITGDYIYRKPPLFHYLNFENISQLYPKLISLGHKVVSHYSRASASLNELMFLSIGLFTLMGVHLLYIKYTMKETPIHFKIYLLLGISSLFIFIPLNVISAGISSMLFAPKYINRFYYASSIFIILPVVTYYFFSRRNIWVVNFIISTIIFFTLIYSKYWSPTNNYYKNIHSIKESYTNSIRFNLSKSDIKLIGEKIETYELLNTTGKQNYYYARDDIALVIKHIYRKPVLWIHHGSKKYQERFKLDTNTTSFPILFRTPIQLSNYQTFK